jgi:hypothetical protein
VRRSPFKILALVLITASAGLLATLPTASLAAQKGLSVDLTWGTTTSDQDRTGALLPSTGAKWVRLTFEWADLEPSKGSYSNSTLATYDRAVSVARSAGMNVDVTVYTTPKWASANGSTSGPPANNADYANVMSFLAKRYRGQVQAWEIWNEENTQRFWSTGSDPTRYAGLLRAAYPAVKAADPGATVVFGGTFGNDSGYLAWAYKAGAKGYFDVMAVHPYSGSEPPDHPWFTGYRGVHDVMVEWGDAKPMWFTEFGWSTTSDSNGVGYGSTGEAIQADYLLRAYRMIEQDPYVQVAIWYNLRNNFWDNDKDGWEFQLGLLYTTFAPKPAYGAFKDYVPGQYVPPPSSNTATTTNTTTSPASGTASALTSTGSTADDRTPTSTVLRVLRGPRGVRASRLARRLVRLRGVVRAARAGRVTLQLAPVGKPLRGQTALSRTSAVTTTGAFQAILRVSPGRWRARAVFAGNSRARPSRSAYVYFRV